MEFTESKVVVNNTPSESCVNIDVSSYKKGDNDMELSHNREQTSSEDSVDVDYTDKCDVVQVLGLEGLDAADHIDQEGANSVLGEDPPLVDCNTRINSDTSGDEITDILDGSPRLWEVEQQEEHQITWVKGRLRENLMFWQDTLKASTPVLDCIKRGYMLPLITQPPQHMQDNQQSALEYSEFVRP